MLGIIQLISRLIIVLNVHQMRTVVGVLKFLFNKDSGGLLI